MTADHPVGHEVEPSGPAGASPPPRGTEELVDALLVEFSGTFSRETVTNAVDDTVRLWTRRRPLATVTPVLAAFVRERLQAVARADGRVLDERPVVLFVCVQNAGRSQAAAALLQRRAGDRVVVRSAGSAPAEAVHAPVAAALVRRGVSLAGAYPKPLTPDVVRAADVVVTMGCGDACPVFPGIRYVDWTLPDPAHLAEAEVDEVVDRIDELVAGLLTALLPTP